MSIERPDTIRLAATNAAVRILDIRPAGCDLITTMIDVIEEEVRLIEVYPDA